MNISRRNAAPVVLGAALLTTTLLSGCNQTQENQATAPTNEETAASPQPAEIYRGVRGQIVELTPPQKAGDETVIAIDHEAIPDFMSAMRMTMPLGATANAQQLKSGDKISFDMTMRGGNFVVENIKMLPLETTLNLAERK